MINEKSEMGFTEYMNARFLEVKLGGDLGEYYAQQATALEKALGIDDNQAIKEALGFLDDPNKSLDWSYNGDDRAFIRSLLVERNQIITYLYKDFGRLVSPSYGAAEKTLSEVDGKKIVVQRALEDQLITCDKYIWQALVQRPLAKVKLKELRENHGFPEKSEIDMLSEYF